MVSAALRLVTEHQAWNRGRFCFCCESRRWARLSPIFAEAPEPTIGPGGESGIPWSPKAHAFQGDPRFPASSFCVHI